ncbi:MAG: Eco57I restriction-modification methylase domain-containing protein [Desulfomonilaceae bacterium]
MATSPEEFAHKEWLGYVQPVGLVVSVPALLAAQAIIDRNIIPQHQRFLSCLSDPGADDSVVCIKDFSAFTELTLGWQKSDLVHFPEDGSVPRELAELEVIVREYEELLRPTYAVPAVETKDREKPWQMLVWEVPAGVDLDKVVQDDRKWPASPHAKFERLLRETEVFTGLLVNGTHLRLVYAPRGETSGHMTFSVSEMAQVAGRPIFAAFCMLLSDFRLFTAPDDQRLTAILSESRKYQNTVSIKLAGQVLAALYELLRGFQAADHQRQGELLREALSNNPNNVYAGLLTVLMRLVFILYAEDRDLMSTDAVYVNHYSITGLFDRLREDSGRFPDTMDYRFGAWAQLLTLFRLVFSGAECGDLKLPARKGYLFDPDRYPFLEGRESESADEQPLIIPLVSDGCIFRILSNLLILDGERLSYRTLDVEQIGSVYEAIMGFYLEVAKGSSIAIKAKKAHGAPVAVNLDELLEQTKTNRVRWFKQQTEQDLSGTAADALAEAESLNDLLVALERKIARQVTPNIVSPGGMVLQPSDERRRSGSHYTPRSLTEPIVRTTLEPILRRLGEQPFPERILELKVCDPAMGSGAFLVEACRQLAEELVKAWHFHNAVLEIPPDEDELLYARRLIAQRCLYGVDRNPLAVDLSKLSLWLATLAKDHPFTFLDHSLRPGDSLVGLTPKQILRFHWESTKQVDAFEEQLRKRIELATEYRRNLLNEVESTPYLLLKQKLGLTDEALELPRFVGNLLISAFFWSEKDRERQERRKELLEQATKWLEHTDPDALFQMEDALNWLQIGGPPIRPFHWELEFPEVFARDNGGFDAMVGNPPFAGKNTCIKSHFAGYLDWLKLIHEGSHGNSDLVAHFFRRSFNLLRAGGCFGLIATNTIGQGDTRATGLRWICNNGGLIYSATKRYKWPGQAAVVVSVVHVLRGNLGIPCVLDGQEVSKITAYLFHSGSNDDPVSLSVNAGQSFVGFYILGMGFTFDDSGSNEYANPISEMNRLISVDPINQERILPFIGGEEVNSDPRQLFHRYIIDFDDMTEEEARKWPDLFSIIEQKVKPQRSECNRERRRKFWWQYGEVNPGLRRAVARMNRVLVNSPVTSHLAFAFIDSTWIFSHTLNVYTIETYPAFAILQARIHEVWARFLSSSLEDRLRYNPSDCFESFPFPIGVLETARDNEAAPENLSSAEDVTRQMLGCLDQIGREYYEFRADLMIRNNEGLTKIYNRFHDPYEISPDIFKLRELHARMDRAVLDAYGWSDLQPTCEFQLDYVDEDEENVNGQSSGGRGRRKPWRYRWPDDFRDEVLARLLVLNKERAEQERLIGLAATAACNSKGVKKSSKSATPRKKKKAKDENQPDLMNLNE